MNEVIELNADGTEPFSKVALEQIENPLSLDVQKASGHVGIRNRLDPSNRAVDFGFCIDPYVRFGTVIDY